MPYWSLPRPHPFRNRSELLATLRNCNLHKLNIDALRGYQLADLLERLESGVPRYDFESSADLLQRLLEFGDQFDFDADPRLFTNSSQAWTRLPRSARFTDLPPELRVSTYNIAFSYSDNAHHLQQPAVARVCRRLRAESLPVFYEINRFGIFVERTLGGFPYGRRQFLTDLWPTFVCNEHLAMMRYFEVTLLNDKCRLRVKIDLPSNKGDEDLNVRVWSIMPEKYMAGSHMQACQQQVEHQMRPVIERLLKEPGVGKFTTREVQLIALSAPQSVRLEGVNNKVLFQL